VRTRLILAVLFVAGNASAVDPGAPNRARPHGVVRFTSPFKQGLPPLTALPLVTLHGKQHLDEKQYTDLSAATQHLLRKYPADAHYFIGLGRDPAPIIAFLQNLGGKQLAINFPASSINSATVKAEVLAEYVKQLVPPDVLESGRAFVFVDVTTSGFGLDKYVPLIAPSLNGAKVIKAAFASEIWTRGTQIFTNPGDKEVIDTTSFPEVDRFLTDPYEDVVSEYPRHVPGVDPMAALESPLPQYAQYRQALMQRMERDGELHGFLQAQGGAAFQAEPPP
jgi:hypothetical protein